MFSRHFSTSVRLVEARMASSDGRREPTTQLTGWQGDSTYFRFLELDKVSPAPIVDVLLGRLAGVIFRAVTQPTVAATIVQRFWTNPMRRRRSDAVPASYLGA